MNREQKPSQLDYQLDFLRLEVETINASIRQYDEITKNIKQWAITLWTAAVGGSLAKPELNKYVGLTAIIPILFWYVDSIHRSGQRRFIWRTLMIKDFLNDGRLEQSIAAGKLTDFEVFNPAARSKGDGEEAMRAFTSLRRTMKFRSVSILYLGLAFLSLFIWLIGTLLGLIKYH